MAEVLHGNVSSGQLNARNDKTQVYGLKGNDTLTSDGKSDVLLVGGSGDDSLIMSGGNGTLSGGEGSDTFELTYSATKKLSAIIEDLDPANDKIIVNFDGNTAPQLTSVTSGNDVVLRDGDGLLTVTLKGVRDNDYLDRNISNEAWKVLELTNAERENQNLSPLTASEGLTAGASIRAEEITSLGMLSLLTNHTRPEDKGNYDTVFKEVGKTYVHYAENLDGGAVTPEEVVEQWMSSDSHKENILNPIYQKLGVGYNYDDPDPTNHRYYWTQLFADSLNNPETVSTAELLTATPEVNAVSKFVTLTEGDDTYSNSDYGATIAALGGGDSIRNSGLLVSISGGNDNDTIDNAGSFTTISAGKGDDLISLSSDAQENIIEYTAGDGNDTISGYNSTDVLSISGGEYTYAKVNGNMIFSVGTDSITVLDTTEVYAYGTWSKRVILTEGNDTYYNTDDGATIAALGGDDSINSGYLHNNVSINGGAGDDSIYGTFGISATIYGGEDTGKDYIENYGTSAIIDGGNGYDTIFNYASLVAIYGGLGNDAIGNSGSLVTIDAGASNDYVENNGESVIIDAGAGYDVVRNYRSNVTIFGNWSDDSLWSWADNISIDGGAGDDTVYSTGNNVTIDSGAGNDSIRNSGSNVIINANTGNDSIYNIWGDSSTIDGGVGNDSIYNSYDRNNVSINGGAGDDTIDNHGDDVTISGGTGDDYIDASGVRTLIKYAAGDGNDTIRQFGTSDTLSIAGGNYIRSTIGNDLVFAVGIDSVILLDAASLSAVNVIGRGTEGSAISGFITLTEGNDTYQNSLKDATIAALGGDDSITNDAMKVSINGGADNDTLQNSGEEVSLNGGTSDDSISNSGDSVTVDAGLGDDILSLSDDAGKTLIKYLPGDGNDTIIGFNEKATLEINSVTGDVSTLTSNNNLIFSVGTDSITIVNAATLTNANIVVKWSDPQKEDNIITLSESNDSLVNTLDGVTIAAIGGNDTIRNEGSNVSISGGTGNDTLYSDGHYVWNEETSWNDELTPDNVTIDGGDGDDYIWNVGVKVSINGGADNDKIRNDSSDVTIDGGSGDDSINNNERTIWVWDETTRDHHSETVTADNVLINGGDGDDTVSNDGSNVTIDGGAGNDSFRSYGGSNIIIDGGDGDDSISTGLDASLVTILGGNGNDSISNHGDSITIDAGMGNDTIYNGDSQVSINSGAGNDSIYNTHDGDSVTIDTGDGDDTIDNYCDTVMVDAGAGNDSVQNWHSNVTIFGGTGKDSIHNVSTASNVSINGGDGNDSITNSGDSVTIDGGDGDDYIEDWGKNTTITGGAGNDKISLTSTIIENNVINYTSGDGNDIIWGFSEKTTINIRGERIYSGKVYETVGSGEDIIVMVGSGSITLKDARDKPLPIIIGESGTEGGGSGSGGSDGGSSSGGGGDGGGRGGNDGGNTSGGTSSNEGRGSDASGGRSAIGSAGRSSSTNTDTGGGAVRVTTSRGGGSRIAVATNISDFMIALTPATQQTTAQPTTNQRIYSGGNQIISDYTSDEKITFGEVYTGSFYDDAGNYCVGSSTGALVIQNAVDKVIDLSDAAGNSVIKAYAATTAGVIDGRGIAGFEIINGSAGADAIFAGDGGSQLWGGADYVQDIMVGGGGTDIFISGRTQGADIVLNASSTDIVHLNDATLSDIIATEENNGVIAVAFNTGNVIAVQSSEALSATFMLTDGSMYRFNHVTKNWQTT